MMAELLRNYGQLIRAADYFLEHMGVLFLHVVKHRSGDICSLLKLPKLLNLHVFL